MANLRRVLLVLVCLVVLGACGRISGEKPGKPVGQTGTDNIRITTVEMRGNTYDCIVYDRKAGYAGMGGLWCERRAAG